LSWESGHLLPEDYVFFDSSGKAWLFLESSGTITVMQGYAWNGCTPKLCFLDLLIGTPDGTVYGGTGKRKTYYASLIHDALYQFLREASPLTRGDADRFFLRLMQESEFVLARLYWLVVRAFGWLAWHGTSRRREWRGRRESLTDLQPTDQTPTESPGQEHISLDQEVLQPGSESEDHETR
jgi:hypothetical protein